ncbi:MAG: HAD family hydrolase [Promethearchaeota archaeon]|nr:MAG: HAD family hydrolase [Candidatus Lokiarchaeota archaeon]
MIRLVAMDLDGTLAEFNKPILPETLAFLKELQANEITLVITSGKEIGHVTGVVRQSGLTDIILVAENGAFINFGHQYPPSRTIMLDMTTAAAEELKRVRDVFLTQFGAKIWIQPNQSSFTIFRTEVETQKIYDFCDQVFKELEIKHLKNFKTEGAIDILPRNIDKGVAIKLIQNELNLNIEETAVIGDGKNDIPMFLQGKLRITFPKSAQTFQQFIPKIMKDINAALKFLLDLIQFEKSTLLDNLL